MLFILKLLEQNAYTFLPINKLFFDNNFCDDP